MNMSEKHAAHLRKVTPIGVITNLFTTLGGFSLIGFLIWHGIEGMEGSIRAIDGKNDSHYKSIYQKIDQVSQRETADMMSIAQIEKNDVLTLTEKVYSCCGVSDSRKRGG